MVEAFGFVSGGLQVIGYLLYIQKTLKKETEPNPTSWLMFAYGTLLITVLEWDKDASWGLLALPIACSFSSIVVALICFFRGTIVWPRHGLDKWAFLADVAVMAGYIATYVAIQSTFIDSTTKNFLVSLFLIIGSGSTIFAFIPMIREMWTGENKEHQAPWTVWTCAYCALTITTFIEGPRWELYIYPISCFFLHLLMVLGIWRGERRGT